MRSLIGPLLIAHILGLMLVTVAIAGAAVVASVSAPASPIFATYDAAPRSTTGSRLRVAVWRDGTSVFRDGNGGYVAAQLNSDELAALECELDAVAALFRDDVSVITQEFPSASFVIDPLNGDRIGWAFPPPGGCGLSTNVPFASMEDYRSAHDRLVALGDRIALACEGTRQPLLEISQYARWLH